MEIGIASSLFLFWMGFKPLLLPKKKNSTTRFNLMLLDMIKLINLICTGVIIRDDLNAGVPNARSLQRLLFCCIYRGRGRIWQYLFVLSAGVLAARVQCTSLQQAFVVQRSWSRPRAYSMNHVVLASCHGTNARRIHTA